MINNPVIEAMLNRKSIRKYTDQVPEDETVQTIVRAGQQAPGHPIPIPWCTWTLADFYR